MTKRDLLWRLGQAMGLSATTAVSHLGRAHRALRACGGILLAGAFFLLAAACPGEPSSVVDAGREAGAGDAAKGTLDAPACTCSGSTNQVTLPLACRCSGGPKGFGDCAADLNEAQTRMNCGLGTVVRIEGCGKVAFAGSTGYTSGGWVFDATTGRLIGVATSSDVQGGPCNAFGYQYGESIEGCAATKVCTWCGQSEHPTCWPSADAGADAAGDVSADH